MFNGLACELLHMRVNDGVIDYSNALALNPRTSNHVISNPLGNTDDSLARR